MLSRIKNIVFKNFIIQNELLLQAKEIEWAHIYHDSIRGKKFLEDLPLNVGRWAGNYSFFYVLNRILADYKPKKILDLGLGESGKFISAYLDNYLLGSEHTIVEQSEEWITGFRERFVLSERSNIIYCPLEEITIKGFKSNAYQSFAEKVTGNFDLYVVDGPFGSDNYSRYDIVSLVDKFDAGREFIIIMDDTDRIGEQNTCNDIINLLKSKGIVNYQHTYSGNKSLTVIASQRYKYATSF